MKQLKKGFTLVEMLVVIAIIGILMALLFPSFTMVIKKAKVTKAKTEISQIEQSWKQYLLDYRKFPSPDITEMNENAVKILAGEDKAKNIRETIYLEANPEKPYTDPWGNTYQVSLDVAGKQQAYNSSSDVYKQVLVWSLGPNGTQDSTKGDDVTNWRKTK